MELVARLSVFQSVILTRNGLHVFIFPVFLTAEFLDDVLSRNELLELLGTAEEMNLGGDYRVEDAVDNLPETLVGKISYTCKVQMTI